MIDPYRLVVVSVSSFVLVTVFFFFYRYVYPKKKIPDLLLVGLLSLLPIISLLRSGAYESGDFNIHVYRNIAFYEALLEGILKPTWSRDLNATYGYPTFLIEAPLNNYIPSFFHFIGFSFISSLKLMLGLFFSLSGFSMYFWARSFLDKTSGVVASIFYMYAPFHLVDLHFRVSPGGILVYAFLPLALLATDRLLKKTSVLWLVILSLSLAALILSHPIAVAAYAFLVLYTIFHYFFYKKEKYSFVNIFISHVLGICVSSFYWAPVVFEKKYILTSLYPTNLTFEQIQFYFFTPWRWGMLFQGPMGELSFLVGYVQWLLILVGVFFLFKKRPLLWKKKLLFFVTSFFVIFFLVLEVSRPLWEVIPFIKNFSITYRFSFLLLFFATAISTIVVKNFKSTYLTVAICIVVILSTILNWGHRRVIPEIQDDALIRNVPYSTAEGEGGPAAMPRWVDKNEMYMNVVPDSHIEVIEGSATIRDVRRTTNKHEYIVFSDSRATLKENTLFYPMWTVLIDGNPVSIDYEHEMFPGVITFEVSQGLHLVEVVFNDTDFRVFVNNISLLSFAILMVISVFGLRKRLTS